MNLVRHNPNYSLRRRSDRNLGIFNDFFDDFLHPFVPQGNHANASERLGLKVDIYHKDDAVFIDAELPGVEKDDIHVDVKGKYVTLGGERKSDTEVKEENCYRRERRYGKFERTFSMPFEVDSDNVTATFKNGVLKLEISKPEDQVVKKIAIN